MASGKAEDGGGDGVVVCHSSSEGSQCEIVTLWFFAGGVCGVVGGVVLSAELCPHNLLWGCESEGGRCIGHMVLL